MAVKFVNPPINELIIAAYFDAPPTDLRSEHIGLYWHRIKDEFPKSSQHAGVGGAEVLSVPPAEIYPMPRYWFISEDEIVLQQVQKNAFMFNWRRRGPEYPHFDEHLKPRFDRNYAKYAEFVKMETGADLAISVAELTYINTIEPCEYWAGPQDNSKVIPSFSQPDIGVFGAQTRQVNCAYTYLVNDDVYLQVSIRDANDVNDPRKPVLVFEIRATSRLDRATKAVADEWWERAHISIIDCFTGMTSKKIQSDYWKIREVTGDGTG